MSDFDKIREFFTSWPVIVVAFIFGGWPGFLLLMWKVLHESAGTKRGNMSDGFKRSVFGSKGADRNLYWDRDREEWVYVDSTKQNAADTMDYSDPAATYSYSYRDGVAKNTSSRARSQAEQARQQVRSELEQARREVEAELQKTRRKVEQTTKTTSGSKKKSTKSGGKKGRKFPKIKDGKSFTIWGGITTGVFGFASIMEIVDALSWGGFLYSLTDIVPLLMFTAVGAGLLLWGRFKNRQASQFRKLLQLVGDAKRVNLRTLSEAAGIPYGKVCDLLQTMIDAGYLGYNAYINLATEELVMDGSAVRTPEKTRAEQPAPEQEAELSAEEDRSILQQIRATNDAIPDEEMSRKISRIEEITGHILDYQGKHPEKATELRKFLSYYLPTTLKILNTYAELDRQKVSGENINATKKRIEGMMDKVVEGFELQLDKLYADEMLDITSDISVMETMLSQDGLAPSSTMKMPKVSEAEQAAREAAAQEAARQNAARQAATAPNAGFTTPGGIHLTLDPEDDAAAGGGAAAQSR